MGYHHNAIGNAQRPDRFGDYGDAVMAEAAERFRADVAALREHFDIRTCTAHGGNVLNHRLITPDDCGVVSVDRDNAAVWRSIRSMFSDGGFLARPSGLREKIDALPGGVHFFRHHPNKYGNYEAPHEIPALDDEAAGPHVELQRRWLEHRARHRLAKRVSRMSPEKPLSRTFAPYAEVSERVERFRARRSAFFLREYPHVEGDPRVFWWRLLERYAPDRGEVLNVGALPPDRRDENTAFIGGEARVVEMDIDAKREPDVLGSISDPPPELAGRFSAVLLFGLPYIDAPGRGIDCCRELIEDGGVGLFGFPDETHPMRGAMWNRAGRPVWRREREPLTNIGLKGDLWCFDEAGLDDLFRRWEHVAVENFSHYWFVHCRSRA